MTDPTSGLTASFTVAAGGSFANQNTTPASTTDLYRDGSAVFKWTMTVGSSPGDGLIIEQGGATNGLWVGFRATGSVFRVRFGSGSATVSNATYLDIAASTFTSQTGTCVVEMNLASDTVRIWWNDALVGSGNSGATSTTLTGNNAGGYGSNNGTVCGGEGTTNFGGSGGNSLDSALTVYNNQVSTWTPPPTSPTAWRGPGTAANKSYEGSTAWTNTSWLLADDSASSNALGGDSQHLRATNFGFTTSDIPSGATITGIEVRYDKYRSGGTVTDLAIYLVKGTADSTADHKGSNKATGTLWPGPSSPVTYGGSSDTWGASLTDSDIRSSDFGATLRASVESGFTAQVDYVDIRVHFSTGTTYNDTRGESAAGADAYAAGLVSARTLAESAASGHNQTAALTIGVTRGESAASADGLAAAKTTASTLAESAATGDSNAVALTVPRTLAESATTGHTQSAVMAFGATRTESAAGTDGLASTGVFGVTFAESAAGADTYTGGLLLTALHSESAAATDGFAGGLLIGGTLAESAAADIAWAIQAAYEAARGESLTSGAEVSGGLFFALTAAETAFAGDTVAGGVTFSTALAETAALGAALTFPDWFTGGTLAGGGARTATGGAVPRIAAGGTFTRTATGEAQPRDAAGAAFKRITGKRRSGRIARGR